MKIKLPEKFLKKVSENDSLNGSLLILLDKFSNWLYENKTEFFPEYTDHGVRHVQSVLDTAEELISDLSWEIVTPQDIYLLTSSILLHDCAMHISKNGLWNLLECDVYNGTLMGFDNEDEWLTRWVKFNSDVKRFSDSDWISFFGEYKNVSLPQIGSDSLDDNQKVLIGDFIRRYHACIAQVIATYGIPCENGPQELFNHEYSYLNQLSGLVARSHNHSLRDVVDILGEEKKREHRNTHLTFIMGVLRIADYMQFKADRTPKILFNLKAFCSPISIREWKKHLSIISTNDAHPDDELLFVESFPEDASTLVSINRLLDGLQKELDEFWAVTGEVYSRYSKLKNLGISYRRVKSNIDNPSKYVNNNHKKYYPEILSVKADNQQLFPLLIKPLYGDLPQVGLRELLQNSIDASNERYCNEIGDEVNNKTIPYAINININFEALTFTLSDSGSGMDVEIIKNYFLKVGASYRTSEVWKSNYTDNNSVFVPRTGKFGIGMLAGFLLGKKIEVHTKHMSSESKAIKFSYELDSKEIELKYSNKDNVGTKIIIHTDVEGLQSIEKGLNLFEKKKRHNFRESDSSWWYFLDSPAITINLIKDNIDNVITPPYIITKKDLLIDWNTIENSSLESFFWRRNDDHINCVYCNGILIKNASPPRIKISLGITDIEIGNVEICVFDNHGQFPLNLTRDDLITDDFFEIEKLSKSVKKSFINKLTNFVCDYDINNIKFIINKYQYIDSRLFPLVITKKNVFPFANNLIGNDGLIFVDYLFSNKKRGVLYNENLFLSLNGMSYSCLLNCEKNSDTVEGAIYNYVLNKRNYHSNESTGIRTNGWVFVKKYDFNKLSSWAADRIESKGVCLTEVNEDWIVISTSDNVKSIPSEGNQIINSKENGVFIFSIYEPVDIKPTEFSILWDECQKEN